MANTIQWKRVKALSFDIFGTLIDWENGIVSTARATAVGPYLPKDDKTLLEGLGKHDKDVQNAHPTMLQSDVIAEGLRRYVNDLKIVADGHLTQGQVEAAASGYGSRIGTYPAFKDTVEAVQSLGKRFKLIPLTNVDNKSFKGTLATGLKGCHFDAIYTAEDVGSYKPSLKNFHYLLDHLKADFDIDKDQLCHVAQSLYHDHAPAKEMKLQSVWVDRQALYESTDENPQEKYRYQMRVTTLRELADIVDKAFESS